MLSLVFNPEDVVFLIGIIASIFLGLFGAIIYRRSNALDFYLEQKESIMSYATESFGNIEEK